MTLTEIWLSLSANGFSSDKGSVHSYLPVYEEILEPFKGKAKNVLEIGIFKGDSLRMWEHYFWASMVYGMDCDIKPHGGLADLTKAIKDGLNVCIGDATNPADVSKYFQGIKFDVVIEDAGHDFDQQLAIFEVMKPYMAWNSIYIIEDIQDIDRDRKTFEQMGGQVVDRRHLKGRYDDCLIVFKF